MLLMALQQVHGFAAVEHCSGPAPFRYLRPVQVRSSESPPRMISTEGLTHCCEDAIALAPGKPVEQQEWKMIVDGSAVLEPR